MILPGSNQSYEIFKYARKAIDSSIDYSRFDVPKAGLKLFAKHAAQFSMYLVDDYQVRDSIADDKIHLFIDYDRQQFDENFII